MKMLTTFKVKGFILIQALLCLIVLSWMAMTIFEQTTEMVKACDRLWWHDQQQLKPSEKTVTASIQLEYYFIK